VAQATSQNTLTLSNMTKKTSLTQY